MNEYAATKAAADIAVGALTRDGLRSIRFRPFNHIGPGQTEKYAISSFAAQIARIERGLQAPVLRVGNLGVERDFLDVRDVVDAYVKGIQYSDRIPIDGIFNVASGRATQIMSLLQRLIEKSDIPINVETDPARVRPSELSRVCGDATKLRDELSWKPRYNIDRTLDDMLEYWRRVVRVG
jgi:GDP-4-dehydro-6-deoxy-D-mannose reductase